MSAPGASDGGGFRVVVTDGAPDDADLAAVVAALLSITTPSRVGHALPAWRAAALLEGTGAARVTDPGGTNAPGRPAW